MVSAFSPASGGAGGLHRLAARADKAAAAKDHRLPRADRGDEADPRGFQNFARTRPVDAEGRDLVHGALSPLRAAARREQAARCVPRSQELTGQGTRALQPQLFTGITEYNKRP